MPVLSQSSIRLTVPVGGMSVVCALRNPCAAPSERACSQTWWAAAGWSASSTTILAPRRARPPERIVAAQASAARMNDTGPAGPRVACALALFRRPEARTVAALLDAAGVENIAPELRRAVVYALARNPQREAAPALRAVLRKEEKGGAAPPPSGGVGWAGRRLGVLGGVH